MTTDQVSPANGSPNGFVVGIACLAGALALFYWHPAIELPAVVVAWGLICISVFGSVQAVVNLTQYTAHADTAATMAACLAGGVGVFGGIWTQSIPPQFMGMVVFIGVILGFAVMYAIIDLVLHGRLAQIF